jgi:predicted ATPase/signal transduction histidine kinase/GAF domain-containing protein
MNTIPNYTITSTVYEGTRTLVYRAVRNLDQQPVVIKVLRNEYPNFNELLQFRNQYTISKNLDFLGIIKSLELEPSANGYALVMEDFGGVSLSNYLKTSYLETSSDRNFNHSSISLADFLPIAIQLTDILHYLYQTRIIHKDIKPANILINPTTKQIKLTDFSIASLLPRETQEIQNANTLEGTLAYLSPEQTGRMNRGIDYRSDFYSLGVTFYSLLTGELPFQSNDPLEIVHCHLAQQAAPAQKINPAIPLVLSAIVSKLMAKNAEDRYQSALGIKYDLELCLEQLKATGEVKSFKIGERDISDRFIIPEKLYGREKEVLSLLNAFDRVASGSSELMLVAGFSGIGKTAVVNEVHKPIVRQRGYFIKGKFDQFNRDIPLSAFVQAFRDLMGQLLSEPDEQLAQWQTKILAAMGENGQVLIEVIPELEQIIGKQPPATELSGSVAQNRFNLLFQKFIEVFTTADHPLVMFLDDLQWADSASFQLIKLLMNDNGYLLMLGAYRDNEVSPVHPFILTVEEIRKAKVIVNTITLTPLDLADTNHLVADTLNCSRELAQPLTELIDRKTQGNPFFTRQFLKALHEDGHIHFDHDLRYWECDIVQANAQALTDDVVEFMTLQLQKLSDKTQQVLKLAACVGNQFDLTTLAIVSEQSPTDAATALWKALQEGLILPASQVYKFFQDTEQSELQSTVNPKYRFLHDRIQQAAYSLIVEEEKKATHLKIGQLLLKSTSPEELEDKIFDIVNHLNDGLELITTGSKKIELANLNLITGRKAKASTAYKTAIKYLNLGIELLPIDRWSSTYDMTFSLYRECAECEYLNGDFDRSKKLFNDALLHSNSEFDRADIYSIEMNLSMTQGDNFKQGIQSGLNGLRILGLDVPDHPEELQVLGGAEFQVVQSNLATINITELFDRPDLEDRAQNLIMLLLVDLWTLAYLDANWYLLNFTVAKIVSLSLEHGNTSLSAFGYVTYGMIIAGSGNYRDAYELGRLALRLNKKFNKTNLIGKVNNLFCHSINPYKKHFRTNIPFYKESYQNCMKCGDLTYGVWALFFTILTQFEVGENLQTIADEAEKYLGAVQKIGDRNMLYSFLALQRGVWNLQGKTERKYTLNDEIFDETRFLEMCHANNFDHGINWYSYLKAQLLYLYGHYTDALNICREAEDKVATNVGFFPVTKYYFYYSLILTKIYPTASESEKSVYWETLQKNQEQIKIWANNCPENFLNQYLLVSAEMARISGRQLEAIDLYEKAIESAKENQFIQNEALANELTAKFWLSQGKEKYAKLHIIAAYYGYQCWGAQRKVEDLEEKYSPLLVPILQQQKIALSATETVFSTISLTTSQPASTQLSSHNSTSISATLDLTTVLKASQTLSSEIQLNKLLATLLHTVLENAGADKGVLLMPRENQWFVEAIATVNQPAQIQSIALSSSSEVPQSLINTVKRSREPVVVVNTLTHPTLAMDAYILAQQPKSLLCTPILNQGKLVAILYLENHVTVGAFTSDRLTVINFLCTQAAISLENAQLYQDSQHYSQQLNQSLEELSMVQSSFQNLVDNVPGVVYQYHLTSDGILSIPYMSTECLRLYEITPEQAVTNIEFLLEFVHPEDITSYQQSTTSATQNLTNWDWEGRIITPSGAIKWIHGESRIQKNANADGATVWDGLFLDISDRKKAELALQQALTDLQNTQLQMIQSEKMSALGNLVAGVAHEISNPVGFLNGNITPALDYIKDLFGLVDLYQQKYPQPDADIQEEIETIDLEYLQEDLPKLISSMKTGVDRIRDISNSLRTFSRADTDRPVACNIHDGIDSTIMILKHRLKGNNNRPEIQVIKEYGDLPQVECFAGQLNQVFMNILANAIDALEESSLGRSFADIKANPNCITITTLVENNRVKIAIADNGKGMSEEVQQKVFDHLFTTKGVGKGTGLGLAIAQQIVVEKHQGKIIVNSEIDVGTEFIVLLPIR